jgi:acyl-CoA reductase-like NAD-dependent aldehyde dehydrogenase
MADRLAITKTYKLFINGQFPRTESGRSMAVEDVDGNTCAHLCHGSRKDLREAVEAASKAGDAWSARTAYNRGQILYRMAEMLEGKADEFQQALIRTVGATKPDARREVEASIDRLIAFAGWTDKYTQIVGCQNPVAGPYYNFTVPEPTGVTAVVAPDEPALLGLITLIAAPICAGNAIVVIASDAFPVPATLFGEVCATSDLPAGVVNIITGYRDELLEHLANHRNVQAIVAANVTKKQAETLRLGVAENIKRVHVRAWAPEEWYDVELAESPWTIEPFVEMKTIWHPSAT